MASPVPFQLAVDVEDTMVQSLLRRGTDSEDGMAFNQMRLTAGLGHIFLQYIGPDSLHNRGLVMER